jgi:hypothetical protein
MVAAQTRIPLEPIRLAAACALFIVIAILILPL